MSSLFLRELRSWQTQIYAALPENLLDIRLARYTAEMYDVYGAKWICERAAKSVRKEEIHLSGRARCYFIYRATTKRRCSRVVAVLRTTRSSLGDDDDRVS